MFFGFLVPSDIKETKFGYSEKEASPSTGKNTGIALVPSHALKSDPIAGFVDIPKVSFVTTDEFSVKVTKITSRIGFSQIRYYLS